MKTRRLLTLLIGLPAAVAVAGMAAAWVTNTGGGTANARVASAVPITLDLGSTPPPLHPGGSAVVRVQVTNPTAAAMVLTAVDPGSSGPLVPCPAAVVRTDARTDPAGLLQASGGRVIAPGASVSYDITARMAADADSACQSLQLPVTLSASLAPAPPAS